MPPKYLPHSLQQSKKLNERQDLEAVEELAPLLEFPMVSVVPLDQAGYRFPQREGRLRLLLLRPEDGALRVQL